MTVLEKYILHTKYCFWGFKRQKKERAKEGKRERMKRKKEKM